MRMAVAPDLFVATTASASEADGFRHFIGEFHMRSLSVLYASAAKTNDFLLLAL
jgi:hypothetical protein